MHLSSKSLNLRAEGGCLGDANMAKALLKTSVIKMIVSVKDLFPDHHVYILLSIGLHISNQLPGEDNLSRLIQTFMVLNLDQVSKMCYLDPVMGQTGSTVAWKIRTGIPLNVVRCCCKNY